MSAPVINFQWDQKQRTAYATIPATDEKPTLTKEWTLQMLSDIQIIHDYIKQWHIQNKKAGFDIYHPLLTFQYSRGPFEGDHEVYEPTDNANDAQWLSLILPMHKAIHHNSHKHTPSRMLWIFDLRKKTPHCVYFHLDTQNTKPWNVSKETSLKDMTAMLTATPRPIKDVAHLRRWLNTMRTADKRLIDGQLAFNRWRLQQWTRYIDAHPELSAYWLLFEKPVLAEPLFKFKGLPEEMPLLDLENAWSVVKPSEYQEWIKTMKLFSQKVLELKGLSLDVYDLPELG